MSHSNSSLNTFTDCEQKYKLHYIDHKEPLGPISPHLTFGTMAHDVLYKAGMLRDCQDDNVPVYQNCIPSDLAYPDEQRYFKINSWQKYFMPIIREVSRIETDLIKSFNDPNVFIEREIKMQLSNEQLEQFKLLNFNLPKLTEPFVGIIDLLLTTKDSAIIVDYKFSTKRKDQDDFDNNSQLYLYAMFVHLLYGIPLRNIQIGYIDIPKQMFEAPILLKNGTLSRSKSMNVSQEMYKAAVTAIHGDDEYYNYNEGGYYYDIVNELALNKCAYLTCQYLDEEICNNITAELMNTAQTIELKKLHSYPFLRKFDSYSCKNCDYKRYCKPYLTEVF